MCQMFFVVSAFLMYSSYDRVVIIKNGNVELRDIFYWILKRFIRLIPLFYLSIIVHMLTGGYSRYWLGSQGHVTFSNIISHLLFIHGLFPYYMDSVISVEWYVGDIAILIVMMPLLYKAIHSTSAAISWIVGTNIVLHFGLPYLQELRILPADDLHIWNTYISDFGFWNQLPVMLIGIALYRLMQAIDLESMVNHKKVLSFVIIFLSIVLQYGLIYRGTNVYMLSGFTLWGIAYALWFISQKIYPIWILNNPIVKLLGKYSYAIYLFHFGIFIRYYDKFGFTLSDIRLNAILRMMIVTAESLITGIVLTQYIEKPCVAYISNCIKMVKKCK